MTKAPWLRSDVIFTSEGAVLLPAPNLPLLGKPAADRRKPEAHAEGQAYTTKQAAKQLNVSEDYARRLFKDEPGVIRLKSAKRGKRPYVTLRIPPEVFERVSRRLSNA